VGAVRRLLALDDAAGIKTRQRQIVDNASKYWAPGSPITVAAKRNGHDVVLSVRDRGVGLTAQENAQIGERFFRGARHAAATSGSGLGLWIAKALANRRLDRAC
jgi:signal transduction histidine kinase